VYISNMKVGKSLVACTYTYMFAESLQSVTITVSILTACKETAS